jgi:4-amino-4-deoxy-L-arabinose transferase-like glycosyltransferase
MRRDEPLAAPLILIAAAIRVAINNVTSFFGDENVYLEYAKAGGYHRVIRMYLDHPFFWFFPSPLRWSYVGVSSLFSTFHGLATLSTICGIVAVALTWFIARELFDARIALFATALVATSPLQLALGRRALSDEFFCAVVLASIASLLLYLRDRRIGWLVTWIVATTFAFGAKEQFLLIYPIVLCFWRDFRWRDVVTWAIPPALYFIVFCILAGDVTTFFKIAHLTTLTIAAPYATQLQNGPPQRLLIDLMALAPLVTIAFIAAAASDGTKVALIAAGIIIVHSLLSTKNVRYIVSADPLMRIAVAAWLPARPRVAAALVILNAAFELTFFYAIFIAAGVYDPVTTNLLHALRMIP